MCLLRSQVFDQETHLLSETKDVVDVISLDRKLPQVCFVKGRLGGQSAPLVLDLFVARRKVGLRGGEYVLFGGVPLLRDRYWGSK